MCRAVIKDHNEQGWPVRHAAVFTWAYGKPMGEPHPAIDHTLDAMDIDLTRTIFGGEAAIVEFLGRRRLPNDSSSRCPLVTIQSSPTLVIMWWQALTDLATNLSTRGEVQDRQGNTENYTTY